MNVAAIFANEVKERMWPAGIKTCSFAHLKWNLHSTFIFSHDLLEHLNKKIADAYYLASLMSTLYSGCNCIFPVN